MPPFTNLRGSRYFGLCLLLSSSLLACPSYNMLPCGIITIRQVVANRIHSCQLCHSRIYLYLPLCLHEFRPRVFLQVITPEITTQQSQFPAEKCLIFATLTRYTIGLQQANFALPCPVDSSKLLEPYHHCNSRRISRRRSPDQSCSADWVVNNPQVLLRIAVLLAYLNVRARQAVLPPSSSERLCCSRDAQWLLVRGLPYRPGGGGICAQG